MNGRNKYLKQQVFLTHPLALSLFHNYCAGYWGGRRTGCWGLLLYLKSSGQGCTELLNYLGQMERC